MKLRQNRKPNYGFVWLDADHPGDDSVKKTVRNTITSAIISEAEQCCSTAELETASQSAPCELCTSEASTADPPPLKRADLHCLLPMRDIVLRPLQ